MSMHTTLDLVLLLLDDIDAGREIDPFRIEQLRVTLLSTDGALLQSLPANLDSICCCLMPSHNFICVALNENRVQCNMVSSLRPEACTTPHTYVSLPKAHCGYTHH